MNLKSTYKLQYHVDKETKELTVIVELLLRDGLAKPFQNLYVGSAMVNGKPYEDPTLEYCVDAKLAAERIGREHKEKMLKRYKKENKRVKIKSEELK